MKTAAQILLITLLTCPLVGAETQDLSALYKKGIEAYLNKDYDSSLEALKTVLEKDPGHTRAKGLLQKVISEQGKVVVVPELKSGSSGSQVKSDVIIPLPPARTTIPPSPQPKTVKKDPPLPKKVVLRPKKDIKKKEPAASKGVPIQKKITPNEQELKKEENEETAANWAGLGPVATLSMALIFSGSLLFLCAFIFIQSRQIKRLEENLEKIRARADKEQAKNLELQKNIEIEKKAQILADEKFKELEKRNRHQETRVSPAPLKASPSPRPAPPTPPLKPTVKAVSMGPKDSKPHSLSSETKKRMVDVLVDVPSAKRSAAWEQISREMGEIYSMDPEEAHRVLRTLVSDPNPLTRAAAAGGLRVVGTAECLEMLLELKNDPEPDPQREALKQIKILYKNEDLDTVVKNKIESILREEIQKGDWVI